MAVTYSSGTKDLRMTAVRTAIDAGGAAGKLEIGTNNAGSWGTTLAQIVLGYSGTSTGTISNGVLTLAGFPRTDADNANATGVAYWGRIVTSANDAVITGLLCGVGTGDIQLENLNITQNQPFQITAVTITHAP